MNANKVLVIGLGQIGYSNAEYMTMKGLTVDGYDMAFEQADAIWKSIFAATHNTH